MSTRYSQNCYIYHTGGNIDCLYYGISPCNAWFLREQSKEQPRIHIRKYTFSERTMNGWNTLSIDCANDSR